MASLVVFSRDPGATERLIAVIEALKESWTPGSSEQAGLAAMRAELAPLMASLRIVSRRPGDAMWRAAGYRADCWPDRSDGEAADYLRDCAAGAVLTGVSDVDEPTDRVLWRAARAAGIVSHAVMDQRVNLRVRFTDASGHVTHPDRVYVPDAAFGDLLAASDIPRERIRIIGDLHLDRARRKFAAIGAAERAELRRVWNTGPERKLVLFISECGREMAALGRAAPYDEFAQLGAFIAGIEASAARCGLEAPGTTIVIRPHPRDSSGKYEAFIGTRPSGLVVTCSSLPDPDHAIAAADLVVGMNSSLLHRASMLGALTVSLTGHPLGDAEGAER